MSEARVIDWNAAAALPCGGVERAPDGEVLRAPGCDDGTVGGVRFDGVKAEPAAHRCGVCQRVAQQLAEARAFRHMPPRQ